MTRAVVVVEAIAVVAVVFIVVFVSNGGPLAYSVYWMVVQYKTPGVVAYDLGHTTIMYTC